ncbi:MAG TPA: hypothetical protein VFU33_07955 [Gaiellaceae bacterium]|nr:hypothetical protein [Gaiellaceae bacterium]
MKISISLAVLATILTGAFSVQQALATTTRHAVAPKTLTIAMHDPGCHWFLIHGKFTKAASAKGPVRLVDRDEAALKVTSRHGLKRIAVGRSVVVGRGNYVIMMVGQAPDDNYLKLTVR